MQPPGSETRETMRVLTHERLRTWVEQNRTDAMNNMQCSRIKMPECMPPTIEPIHPVSSAVNVFTMNIKSTSSHLQTTSLQFIFELPDRVTPIFILTAFDCITSAHHPHIFLLHHSSDTQVQPSHIFPDAKPALHPHTF